MEISRTVFKREIITEFVKPAIRTKEQKVIILCQGMPSVPRKDELIYLLSKKGFWIFFPRYRGSWESGGKFLRKSPHQDILDILDQLPRGFKDSRTEKTIKLKPDKIFLVGSSFGGPAALLASKDKRVDKVICISPVIDWTTRKERNRQKEKFLKEYFGRAYNFNVKDWRKLEKGNFYNPIAETGKLEGGKILIFHAKDDKAVSYKPSQKFARLTGCELKLLKKGGHFGLSFLLKNKRFLQTTLKFFE